MTKSKTLRTLFLSMLYISAFTFGGGFVIVTFMKRKFVDQLHWLEESEMLDMTALSQVSPGAIAVNAAILIGWRMAGILGMFSAVLGTIIPPMGILTIVSFFYEMFAANPYVAMVLGGMQAGVAAVILDVVCNLGSHVVKSRSWISNLVMICSFIATFFLRVNVLLIILFAALIGIGKTIWTHYREVSA